MTFVLCQTFNENNSLITNLSARNLRVAPQTFKIGMVRHSMCLHADKDNTIRYFCVKTFVKTFSGMERAT